MYCTCIKFVNLICVMISNQICGSLLSWCVNFRGHIYTVYAEYEIFGELIKNCYWRHFNLAKGCSC